MNFKYLFTVYSLFNPARCKLIILLLLFQGTGSNSRLIASTLPEVNAKIELDLSESTTDNSFVIGGSINYSTNNSFNSCIYLPYNDPKYVVDELVRPSLAGVNSKSTANFPIKRSINLSEDSKKKLKQITPYLWQISSAQKEVFLEFESSMEPTELNDDIFFDGYLPQLLTDCEIIPKKNISYQVNTGVSFDVSVVNNTTYKFYSQNLKEQLDFQFKGNRLSFVLLKNYKIYEWDLLSTPIRILYKNKEFLNLVDTIKKSFVSHSKLFSKYPFKVLNIVESSHLESSQTAGIVSLNRPKQDLFRLVQMDILNWYHWILVRRLAFQWYGCLVDVKNPDDYWFLQGMAELGALEALRDFPAHFNLFNFRNLGYSLLSFDYITIQDLKAALLNKYSPNSVLTDSDYNSYESIDSQFPFIYIKQAIMLRYLQFVGGYHKFSKFIHKFTLDQQYTRSIPKNFIDSFSKLPSPFSLADRVMLKNIVSDWWQNDSWPDYSVQNIQRTQKIDGTWVTDIEIKSNFFSYPVEIKLDDEKGFSHYGKAVKSEEGEHLTARIYTQYKSGNIYIDPIHHLFDSDRFDNSDQIMSGVKFFPGNATTLADDSHTVLWFPFIFRRSGENFSLAFYAVIFRYLHGYIYGKYEKDLGGEKDGYELIYGNLIYSLNLESEIKLKKDFVNTTTKSFKLNKLKFINFDFLKGDLGLTLRYRGNELDPTENHATGSLGSTMYFYLSSVCSQNLKLEEERTLENYSKSISYNKTTIRLSSSCDFSRLRLSYSIFGGKLFNENEYELPKGVKFRPQNHDEANIRLDTGGVLPVNSIVSLNLNLSLPFVLEIPHWFFVLKGRIRGHNFVDYGYSEDLDTRYLSTGLGISLPLGGDFVGSGPIALSLIDMNIILYSRINDEINRDPRFLIGLKRTL